MLISADKYPLSSHQGERCFGHNLLLPLQAQPSEQGGGTRGLMILVGILFSWMFIKSSPNVSEKSLGSSEETKMLSTVWTEGLSPQNLTLLNTRFAVLTLDTEIKKKTY